MTLRQVVDHGSTHVEDQITFPAVRFTHRQRDTGPIEGGYGNGLYGGFPGLRGTPVNGNDLLLRG